MKRLITTFKKYRNVPFFDPRVLLKIMALPSYYNKFEYRRTSDKYRYVPLTNVLCICHKNFTLPRILILHGCAKNKIKNMV